MYKFRHIWPFAYVDGCRQVTPKRLDGYHQYGSDHESKTYESVKKLDQSIEKKNWMFLQIF